MGALGLGSTVSNENRSQRVLEVVVSSSLCFRLR